MFRPFVTALLAVVLTGAFAQVTDAHETLHTVAAGETLAAIAASAGISLERLAQLNQIDGDVRTLPAGTLLAVDEAGVAALAPEVRAPATVADLRAFDRATVAAASGADLTLWGGAQGKPTPVFVARHAKRADTMRRFARGIVSRTSSIALNLTRDAMRFIGTPYVFGGTSSSGFDCSGYVQHVFAMLGIALPRTADAQYDAGLPPSGGVVAGDLVFFQTYLPGPSHVGIYLGSGRFIHSSGHGVMISHISDRYWAARYLGAKRVSARLALR